MDFSSQNPMKIRYYDLAIYLLTLKITLNHQRTIRNGYFKITRKRRITLLPTVVLLIEILQVHMSPKNNIR